MNKQRKQFLYSQLHLVCGAAIFCTLSFTSMGANAQTLLRPFSADQIHTVGNKTTAGKVYARPSGPVLVRKFSQAIKSSVWAACACRSRRCQGLPNRDLRADFSEGGTISIWDLTWR